MSVLIQQLDNNPGLRIKFVCKDDHDGWRSYSDEAYWGRVIAGGPPPGWAVRALGPVRTKADTRPAWELTQNTTTIGVVSHETGIEILIAIGIGIAGGVGSTVIVDLAKWFLQKNATQVHGTPIENRIAIVVEVNEDGTSRRMECSGAGTQGVAEVRRIVDNFMSG